MSDPYEALVFYAVNGLVSSNNSPYNGYTKLGTNLYISCSGNIVHQPGAGGVEISCKNLFGASSGGAGGIVKISW